MPKRNWPPPGLIEKPEVLRRLSAAHGSPMAQQALYKSGVNEILDYYGTGYAPNLYDEQQVADFAYWLLYRRALIALGVWKVNHRLADPDWQSIIIEDAHGIECGRCGARAAFVAEPYGDEGAEWCENCGFL